MQAKPLHRVIGLSRVGFAAAFAPAIEAAGAWRMRNKGNGYAIEARALLSRRFGRLGSPRSSFTVWTWSGRTMIAHTVDQGIIRAPRLLGHPLDATSLTNPAMTIFLVRHGETEWNRARRYQGWSDSPLTARGTRRPRRSGIACARCPSRGRRDVASPTGRGGGQARSIALCWGAPHAVVRRTTARDSLARGWLDRREIRTRMGAGFAEFEWYFRTRTARATTGLPGASRMARGSR